jgi:cysteine desulfurase/selenocysteine lyase
MLGPTGIGVLYARRELLERMEPIFGGGDMIARVDEQRSTWNDLPWKFEAGTPNFADAVAFGAAIDYLTALGMAEVREHERELTAYAHEALGEVPQVKVYGPLDPARRGGTVAFNFGGLHPHDLATVMDYEGVAIRGGHHCCQVLMRRLDVAGTSRASFYVYNTRDDVDTLVGALAQAKVVFGDVAGLPL